jgi:negative regulator of sigma E activity
MRAWTRCLQAVVAAVVTAAAVIVVVQTQQQQQQQQQQQEAHHSVHRVICRTAQAHPRCGTAAAYAERNHMLSNGVHLSNEHMRTCNASAVPKHPLPAY